jgi:prepilin-type N-terminal cleavage/methylation domain-containing protein/prepilin-type processing-associated H-X9-DG protein
LTLYGINPKVLVMRRLGFTLIELLVTIGILAALMAIFTPALNKSRVQAKATVCASNVKQLNNSLFGYAADNGRFPYGLCDEPNTPPDGNYAGGQYDRAAWWWFNFLKGTYTRSMGKRTVLQCPSKQLRNQKLDKSILTGNYGVNLSICKIPKTIGSTSQDEFRGVPLADVDIKHPSQTLLVMDSGYAIISWWHASDISPESLGNKIIEDTAYVPGLKINKDRQLWRDGSQNIDAIFGRHPRKIVNVGYADGHVARPEADDLLVEKTPDGYKNLVPLWRPK